MDADRIEVKLSGHETGENTRLNRREFLRLSLWGGAAVGLSFSNLDKKLTAASPTTDVANSQYNVNLPIVEKNYTPPEQIRGLCYGPYRDGQNPNWGPYPSEAQMKEDIAILTQITDWVRTYGSDHLIDQVPRYITEKGSEIKVDAGCWLGDNSSVNQTSINNVINEANNNSNVFSVTVGNETQTFNTFSEEQLIYWINLVKQNVPSGVMVTTGETWYQWSKRPGLVNAVDHIFAHFHPYWEGILIDNAVPFIQEKYNYLRSLYPDKKTVIGETNWPSAGDIRGGAIPNVENQRRFIDEFVTWARQNSIDFYLFEAFDEKWKTMNEGEVGAHWGVYNSDRTSKHPGFTLK